MLLLSISIRGGIGGLGLGIRQPLLSLLVLLGDGERGGTSGLELGNLNSLVNSMLLLGIGVSSGVGSLGLSVINLLLNLLVLLGDGKGGGTGGLELGDLNSLVNSMLLLSIGVSSGVGSLSLSVVNLLLNLLVLLGDGKGGGAGGLELGSLNSLVNGVLLLSIGIGSGVGSLCLSVVNPLLNLLVLVIDKVRRSAGGLELSLFDGMLHDLPANLLLGLHQLVVVLNQVRLDGGLNLGLHGLLDLAVVLGIEILVQLKGLLLVGLGDLLKRVGLDNIVGRLLDLDFVVVALELLLDRLADRLADDALDGLDDLFRDLDARRVGLGCLEGISILVGEKLVKLGRRLLLGLHLLGLGRLGDDRAAHDLLCSSSDVGNQSVVLVLRHSNRYGKYAALSLNYEKGAKITGEPREKVVCPLSSPQQRPPA